MLKVLLKKQLIEKIFLRKKLSKRYGLLPKIIFKLCISNRKRLVSLWILKV